MALDEAARHQLYTRLAETLGEEPTSTLMSLLPPVGWADVATKGDLRALEDSLRAEIAELRAEVRGIDSSLRGEIAELRAEVRGIDSSLRGEIAELRAEVRGIDSGLRGDFEGLRGEFAQLRGDVTGEIAALESRFTTALRQQLFAMIAAMAAIATLTVGATAALG